MIVALISNLLYNTLYYERTTTMIKQYKAAAEEQLTFFIINTDMDKDQIKQVWASAWESHFSKAELEQIWEKMMLSMPEFI